MHPLQRLLHSYATQEVFASDDGASLIELH